MIDATLPPISRAERAEREAEARSDLAEAMNMIYEAKRLQVDARDRLRELKETPRMQRGDEAVLRMSEVIPEDLLARLRELQAMVSTVRGWTPLDSPERAAEDDFKLLLAETLDRYRMTEWHLAPLIGMQPRSLVAWMRGHGLKKQAPSQKSYRGVFIDRNQANLND